MTMNTRTISKCVGGCILGLAASCTSVADDGIQRVYVTDTNDLGLTALQTTRALVNGNDVFTLRGLSADDDELASVQLTIGNVPELAAWAPDGPAFGSEIVIAVAGIESRIVTHETEHFMLGAQNATMMTFLGLAAVSSTLEHEANVFVEPATADPIGEQTYQQLAVQCAASYLNTTPVAGQCCEQYTRSAPNTLTTHHVNPTNAPKTPGAIITRYHNPNFGFCKASDGVSPCSGNGCYYGPNGFSKPFAQLPGPGAPYGHIYTAVTGMPPIQDTLCQSEFSATPLSPVFGNVTGTFATGQGCPGSDGGGGLGAWDY